MRARPVEHLIHGQHGPIIIVTARVAAYLNRHAGLDEYRRATRGADAEVDLALQGFRMLDMWWRESATGTKKAPEPELDASFEWLSTTQAGTQLGVTDRAIRKAIDEGRLKALRVDDRWRISRTDFEHYRAGRSTQ
jgi:excisionase family DNA binding protein